MRYRPASESREAPLHRTKPISSTHEMYLKVLHEARGSHGVTRVSDLARRLELSPGTVSSVLKKLEQMRLVEHERYGLVALTRDGNDVAECVLRRYETIHRLLVEVLGVAPATAAIDACMMEHAVSPETIARMQELLEQGRAQRARSPRRRKRRDLCAGCESLGVCRASGDVS